jgi:4,5:9,10-diseco-3-hydroxy-5,9,17-trioxoandrosta-1(10),2-diene-4-oate hydrolase
MAQLPGFMETTEATLRAQADLGGQREVLVDQFPDLGMPTLVMWGKRDRVFPYSRAQTAVSYLRQGFLELIPDCGHLPHIEQSKRFVAILSRFLDEQASY